MDSIDLSSTTHLLEQVFANSNTIYTNYKMNANKLFTIINSTRSVKRKKAKAIVIQKLQEAVVNETYTPEAFDKDYQIELISSSGVDEAALQKATLVAQNLKTVIVESQNAPLQSLVEYININQQQPINIKLNASSTKGADGADGTDGADGGIYGNLTPSALSKIVIPKLESIQYTMFTDTSEPIIINLLKK